MARPRHEGFPNSVGGQGFSGTREELDTAHAIFISLVFGSVIALVAAVWYFFPPEQPASPGNRMEAYIPTEDGGLVLIPGERIEVPQ